MTGERLKYMEAYMDWSLALKGPERVHCGLASVLPGSSCTLFLSGVGR